MPVSLFSAAERARLERFPDAVTPTDLLHHFTLSPQDLQAVRGLRGDANRLGFALQLAALRFLGFVPPLDAAPEAAVRRVAAQVGAGPEPLERYGAPRPRIVWEHYVLAIDHAGYRRATPGDLDRLERWLTARALEHDRPTVLFEAACSRLHRQRVVAVARTRARNETLRLLRSVLTPGVRSTLGWLRRRASADTPGELLGALEKVEWLRARGVDRWDLSAVDPNRLKLLAGLVAALILDSSVPPRDLRPEVFRFVTPLELAAHADEARPILHPEGRAFFSYLDARYGYVRQFAPAFLAAVPLLSSRADDAVIMGVRLLKRLNREGMHQVPGDAPTAFVTKRWRPFVFDGRGGDRALNRHGRELCLLSALRGRLRSGDVYTEPSARYADPESYPVDQEAWPPIRSEACEQLGLTASGRERIAERARELSYLLGHLDKVLGSQAVQGNADPASRVGEVWTEDGQLSCRLSPPSSCHRAPPNSRRW